MNRRTAAVVLALASVVAGCTTAAGTDSFGVRADTPVETTATPTAPTATSAPSNTPTAPEPPVSPVERTGTRLMATHDHALDGAESVTYRERFTLSGEGGTIDRTVVVEADFAGDRYRRGTVTGATGPVRWTRYAEPGLTVSTTGGTPTVYPDLDRTFTTGAEAVGLLGFLTSEGSETGLATAVDDATWAPTTVAETSFETAPPGAAAYRLTGLERARVPAALAGRPAPSLTVTNATGYLLLSPDGAVSAYDLAYTVEMPSVSPRTYRLRGTWTVEDARPVSNPWPGATA